MIIKKAFGKKIQENGGNPNHIYFIQASGCWSNVGKIGGRQLISIGYGCEAVKFFKFYAILTFHLIIPSKFGYILP